MLNWSRTDQGAADQPLRDPAAAAKQLGELRSLEPAAALTELAAWLATVKSEAGIDEKTRGELLALLLDASAAPGTALLAPWIARSGAKPAAHEAEWHALTRYLRDLTLALGACAGALLAHAAAEADSQAAGAAAAARALHACRRLAKACFVRYASLPAGAWQAAYAAHAAAEQAGCADAPVRVDAAHKTTGSATSELLCLLMLQAGAPDMMSPEEIEVADRVVEQFGAEFTLRPRGVADNPFCFDPASDAPPRRAEGDTPNIDVRHFGAGAGYDALERVFKQLAAARGAELMVLGKDIALHVQLAAIRHLGLFWAAASRYRPPARTPASGRLSVVHGFAQIWQHVSSAGTGATELTLAEDGDTPSRAPDEWTLQDTGGNELGAEIPASSAAWARCGDLVGVTFEGEPGCAVGLIRAMHAEPGKSLRAVIAILSRTPQALQLLALVAKNEEVGYSLEASRLFAFNRVRAIILADGGSPQQKPNLLLPPEHWRENCVYEAGAGAGGEPRYLRSGRPLRRGEDYLRAIFEWTGKPA